jgi:hypothetical protein
MVVAVEGCSMSRQGASSNTKKRKKKRTIQADDKDKVCHSNKIICSQGLDIHTQIEHITDHQELISDK